MSDEDNSYTQIVERGIQWLDKNYPEGWRDRISISDLLIQNPCRCILGQLEGSFGKAIERWDISGVLLVNLGFDVYSNTEMTEDYRDLNRAWLDALKGGGRQPNEDVTAE